MRVVRNVPDELEEKTPNQAGIQHGKMQEGICDGWFGRCVEFGHVKGELK